MSRDEAEVPDALEHEDVAVEPPPDGGYGWVIVGSCFTVNCFCWGVTAVSAVIYSYKDNLPAVYPTQIQNHTTASRD